MKQKSLSSSRINSKSSPYLLNTLEPQSNQQIPKSSYFKQFEQHEKKKEQLKYIVVQPKVVEEINDKNEKNFKVTFKNTISDIYINQQTEQKVNSSRKGSLQSKNTPLLSPKSQPKISTSSHHRRNITAI